MLWVQKCFLMALPKCIPVRRWKERTGWQKHDSTLFDAFLKEICMQLEILQHGKRRITQLELLLRSAHQVFPRLDDQQMNAFHG